MYNHAWTAPFDARPAKATMHLEYLNLLPNSIRAKVDEIEKAVGHEVVVSRGDTAVHQQGTRAPPVAVCVCEEREGLMHVEITLSNDAAPHSLVHEILHAHRSIVLGVPRLIDDWKPGSSLEEAIENDAEHIFIVPEEIALFAEARDFWYDQHSALVSALEQRLDSAYHDQNEIQAVKHGFLRLFLVASATVPDWPGRADLCHRLQLLRWDSDASSLVEQATRVEYDKSLILAALISCANLPRHRFRLRSWPLQQGGMVGAVFTPLPSI
jgi:hypothetical protein